MANEKILVVDDEESFRQFLSIMLGNKEGYNVETAASGEEALEKIKESAYDVVITDIRMRGMSGVDLLDGIKEFDPNIPVIILTAYATLESAIDAVNKGAFYYMIKNVKKDEIKLVVRRALEMRQLKFENIRLRSQLKKEYDSKEIIGISDEFKKVMDIVKKVAPTDSTILIHGDSGTGKEIIAREIHRLSNRSNGEFVTINCGALPENLLESELFGHVKGSFTGAIKDKIGLFEVADKGSLFLDEVGETSAAIQVKLLRALQEREIIPVGGTKPIKVDVRIIAATNSNLERKIENNTFRSDLYYRLNVIPIHLPTLKERKDDILLLARYFLKKYCEANKVPLKKFSPDVENLFMEYDWPGNVRELQNTIERAVILQESDIIRVSDIPDKIRKKKEEAMTQSSSKKDPTLEELEKEYIITVLIKNNWHRGKAAEVLGIDPSTLSRKIQRYNIDEENIIKTLSRKIQTD